MSLFVHAPGRCPSNWLHQCKSLPVSLVGIFRWCRFPGELSSGNWGIHTYWGSDQCHCMAWHAACPWAGSGMGLDSRPSEVAFSHWGLRSSSGFPYPTGFQGVITLLQLVVVTHQMKRIIFFWKWPSSFWKHTTQHVGKRRMCSIPSDPVTGVQSSCYHLDTLISLSQLFTVTPGFVSQFI